ncbi:hypothetical protein Syun_024329 [Stephania yunnanensis]|uniref:RRM domain-containing protein n=1 Tax=Stephania yunnanensis TaxID=152371 RepID=A0AAP0I467_9MAGN
MRVRTLGGAENHGDCGWCGGRGGVVEEGDAEIVGREGEEGSGGGGARWGSGGGESPSFPPISSPLVASTSDWAQQEEEEEESRLEEPQEEGEFGWENQQIDDRVNWESGEEVGGTNADADADGEVVGSGDEEAEGEGEGDGQGFFDEPLNEDAKLFVGNLPYDVDSEKLAQLFDQAGVVEVAEVIYNRDTDQSRGFGFVTMSTVEEAEKAVDTFNRYGSSNADIERGDFLYYIGLERYVMYLVEAALLDMVLFFSSYLFRKDLGGRLLTVNKAAPRGARPERSPRVFESSFRIYVGNLPWQVDNARLEQVFSEHGKVVEARVVYDRESGRSRGFGFVTMASQAEMDDAIAALDGQSLDGRAIRANAAEERPRRGSF